MNRAERRVAGGAGLAFVVMSVVASFAAGTPPAFDDPLPRIRAFFIENDSQLVAGAFLQVLSVVFALILFTGLRRILGDADRSGADMATLFYAAAVASAAVLVVGVSAGALPAWQSEQVGPPSDQTVRLMFDLSALMSALVALFVALLVGAASAAVLRTRTLPTWVAWTGAVVVLGNLLAGLGMVSRELLRTGIFVGYLPFMAWVVATSVALLVAPDEGLTQGAAPEVTTKAG